MHNEYPGTCKHCRARIEARAGVLVKQNGRFWLYCLEHETAAYSQAVQFAATLPPAPEPGQPLARHFNDGSIAKWNGRLWLGCR